MSTALGEIALFVSLQSKPLTKPSPSPSTGTGTSPRLANSQPSTWSVASTWASSSRLAPQSTPCRSRRRTRRSSRRRPRRRAGRRPCRPTMTSRSGPPRMCRRRPGRRACSGPGRREDVRALVAGERVVARPAREVLDRDQRVALARRAVAAGRREGDGRPARTGRARRRSRCRCRRRRRACRCRRRRAARRCRCRRSRCRCRRGDRPGRRRRRATTVSSAELPVTMSLPAPPMMPRIPTSWSSSPPRSPTCRASRTTAGGGALA